MGQSEGRDGSPGTHARMFVPDRLSIVETSCWKPAAVFAESGTIKVGNAMRTRWPEETVDACVQTVLGAGGGGGGGGGGTGELPLEDLVSS